MGRNRLDIRDKLWKQHVIQALKKQYKITFIETPGDLDRQILEIVDKLEEEVSPPFISLTEHSHVPERVVREVFLKKIEADFLKQYEKTIRKRFGNIDKLLSSNGIFQYLREAKHLFIFVFPMQLIFHTRFVYETLKKERILSHKLKKASPPLNNAQFLAIRMQIDQLYGGNLNKEFKNVFGAKGIKIDKKIDEILKREIGSRGFVLFHEFIHGNILSVANYIEAERNLSKVFGRAPVNNNEVLTNFYMAPYALERGIIRTLYQIFGIVYLSPIYKI